VVVGVGVAVEEVLTARRRQLVEHAEITAFAHVDDAFQHGGLVAPPCPQPGF